MNDKLFVFRSVFYGAVPQYQRVFLEKKQKALEDKLKEEKALFEKEMNAMSSKARRRMLKKHPEMMKTTTQPTPNKYQDLKGREGSGLNELLGLPSLEQARGSAVTAQQMIDNLRMRKKIGQVEPPLGPNVKSRYRSTLSAKPEVKRANSTTDATQVRRGSLASSGHSRSRPGPLVNPKAEKPSFDVAAAHRIKEADEQDETMTPVPKRYANRLEAKQAYAAKREAQGKLDKLEQPRSESSREQSVTLGDGGCGDSRVGVAGAEEELRADDASEHWSILHSSAPGLQPEITQADGLGAKAEQLQRLLAAGPLPETGRGQPGPTRTLSLGNIEKKVSSSSRKLLGSSDGSRAPEHGLSGPLRLVHQNAPKMSTLASTKSRQKANGGPLAAAAYHTGPTHQKAYLSGAPPHLRNLPRPEKNRPYVPGKHSSNLSLNARSGRGSLGSARSGCELGEGSKTSSTFNAISLPTNQEASDRQMMTTLTKSPYF